MGRIRTVFQNLLLDLGYGDFDYGADFNAKLKRDAERRMGRIDDFPPELRRLIHEFGYHAVNAFLDYQITNPKTIRYLICAARGIMPDSGHAVKENHRPYKLHQIEGRRTP